MAKLRSFAAAFSLSTAASAWPTTVELHRELQPAESLGAVGHCHFEQREEVMVVSGGSYESAGELASVEAYDGQSWSLDKVAPLPRQVSEHCMIKVDDSVLMTIGGVEFSNGITNSSNFYDGNTNSWTPGFNY
jgi:hypothetical protein